MRYLPNIPRPRMPSVNFTRYLPSDEDKLCQDEEGKKQREDVLKRQKWNTFFNSVKTIFMFISGPLIGAGLGILLPALKPVLFEAAKVTPATMEAVVLGSSLLGAATLAAGVAVVASQLGGHIYHAAVFDQSEINAQHTAKYVGKAIRKELEDMQNDRPQTPPVVVFNNPEAERSDGKKWAQHLEENEQLAANNNKTR